MEIPDTKIACLRCTNEEVLDPGAVQKDANGVFRPVNVKRPEGWIVGPAALHDVTQGICPRCAPDWNALQKAFLQSEPSDPAIEVRPPDPPPISFPDQGKASLTNKVGTMHSTHIPLPVAATAGPRITSIPQRAQPVAQPHRTTGIAPPPPSVRQINPMGNVTVAPTRVMLTPSSTQPTRISRNVASGPVSTLMQQGQAVKVEQSGGVAHSVAPTSMQKIVQAPPVEYDTTAPGQTSYAVKKVERGVTPVGRNSQIIGPAVHAPAAAPGSVVSVSAPVPIPQMKPDSSVVTISAPVPIAPK